MIPQLSEIDRASRSFAQPCLFTPINESRVFFSTEMWAGMSESAVRRLQMHRIELDKMIAVTSGHVEAEQ